MELKELFDWLREFGLPVVLLVVVGFAIRSFFHWCAQKFDAYIEPVAKAHLQLIDKIETALADQAEILRHVAEKLGIPK